MNIFVRQSIVSSPSVGTKRTSSNDHFTDEGVQVRGRCIGNRTQTNSPKPFRTLALHIKDWATAIATTSLLVPRPRLSPVSIPPINVSSTSTSLDNCSRTTRSIATRKRGNIIQATRQLMPIVCSHVLADRPFFAVVTCPAASNQVVSGVRVLSKIVPVVTEH